MRIRAGAVCLAIACTVWACTTPASDSSAPAPAPALAAEPIAMAVDEDGLALMPVAVVEPTEAMLKAALTEDPEAMRDAAASLSGCQAASTCPAEFGSCTAWSASTLCDQQCGIGICRCSPIWACEGEPPEIKGSESYNSYRICFNQSGQACTEFQKTTNTVCGC